MSEGLIAILLLILVPILGAVGCLAFENGRSPRYLVGLVVGVTMIASLYLFYYMWENGLSTIVALGSELGPANLIILVLGFVLPLLIAYLGWKMKSKLIILFSILQIIPLIYIETAAGADADPVLYVDYLSVIMCLITSLIGGIILLYAIPYMRQDGRQPYFFAVMLLFLGVMNAAVFCNRLSWLFFFWELTSLCSFLLIGFTRTDEAKVSARRALTYQMAGGLAFVIGVALLQYYFFTLSIVSLPANLQGLQLLPIALLALAAFVKSAQVPFQKWLLGAMVAPTPVSALLHSVTMVNLGVYLLIRFSPQVDSSPYLHWTIALVGVISFVACTILAITQSNAKRVLAYSTIGNLGLIFICIGIDTPLSITAALVLLIFHSIAKALIFLSMGVFKDEAGTDDIEAMQGLRDRMPFVALAFLFGAFFLALPPFGMLAGKWMISEAGITMPLIGILLAIGIAAPAVYLGKWAGLIFAADKRVARAEAYKEKLPHLYRYTLASLVGGGLVLSFLMGYLVEGLVNPFVRRTFGSIAVDNSSFNLVSSLGAFPYLALLIIFSLLFVGLAVLTRPEERELSDPYTCGEKPEFEIAGQYYAPEKQVLQATKVINLLAAAVIAAMVVIPMLLEVNLW